MHVYLQLWQVPGHTIMLLLDGAENNDKDFFKVVYKVVENLIFANYTTRMKAGQLKALTLLGILMRY